MATLKEVDHIVVNGSEEELPTQEEAVEEQTPERRHVDVLLDISEEDFMKELEPHECHCYSGWEDAVHGWARVAPLSCILLTQKKKHADNPRPLTVDPTILDANSSTSIAERRCESHVGLHNSFKKPIPLNQHTGSWGNTAVEALQKDGSEWSAVNPLQKTTSKLPLEEKIEKEGTLRDTSSQPQDLPSKYSNNGATKPQKQRYRPNNTVAPVKNITFLPAIISIPPIPQTVNSQLCGGRKAQEGETIEENCLVLDARSGTRGARVDRTANPEPPSHSAVLTSKYQTCQHSPHLFSAVSVPIHKRYQVPMSSKPDTVHRTSSSTAESLTQALPSSTASHAQGHSYPSKTVCM